MHLRIAGAVVVCAALAAPACADVTFTMKVRQSQSEPKSTAAGERIDYISGHKLRTDLNVAGERRSIIIDADTGQLILLEPEKRIATVVDLQSLSAGIRQHVRGGGLTPLVIATPRTRQIAGAGCTVHDLKVTLPLSPESLGSFVVTGSACLAKDGPGAADVSGFYRAAAEKGLLFGDPSAPTEPAPAILMMAVYRELVARGVPLATDLKLGTESTGAMADLMKQMGASDASRTTTTEAVSVSTARLPPSLFEIPDGYQVVKV